MPKNPNMRSLNGGNNQQPKQQIELDKSDVEIQACECGSEVFTVGIQKGKLSAAHPKNPYGESVIVNVPVEYCAKCFTPVNANKE